MRRRRLQVYTWKSWYTNLKTIRNPVGGIYVISGLQHMVKTNNGPQAHLEVPGTKITCYSWFKAGSGVCVCSVLEILFPVLDYNRTISLLWDL